MDVFHESGTVVEDGFPKLKLVGAEGFIVSVVPQISFTHLGLSIKGFLFPWCAS